MLRFGTERAGVARLPVLVSVVGAITAAALWSAGSAWAAGQQLCVAGPGTTVTAPVAASTCPSGRTLVTLATQSEVATLQSQVAALQAKLSKVSYSATGLNGKPTLKVSGANLQVVNGAGATDAPVNGLGNVIIGYDEGPGAQTGSHNLVLGYHQSLTTWGGIVGGVDNTLSGAASVVFGAHNNANGSAAAITGGEYNLTTDAFASISGGCENLAGLGQPLDAQCGSLGRESVSGGDVNVADGPGASVAGGYHNIAFGGDASILGGAGNTLTTKCATLPSYGQSCP
jgi:hypothetical protein